MDLVVLYNAEAGDGAWSASRVARLLHDAGHSSRVVDRKEEWLTALEEDPDAFVAVGGDGTVHEVIRAMARRRASTPVAILPIGTANNVAHSLGYEVEDDLVARASRWDESIRPLRVGSVRSGDDERLLVETFGIGAFARQLGRPDSNGNKPASPLSLLAMRESLVRRLLDAPSMEAVIDIDEASFAHEVLLIECVNLGYLGPRLCLAPEEAPGDGRITVCGVGPEDREIAAHWVSTGEGDVERFQLGRGRAITITLPAGAPGHVDGQQWPEADGLGGELRVTSDVHTVHVTV